MPAKNSHPAVKKHFGVRALVSLLMLVVDYEVPVDCNTADVFNVWVRVINLQWAKSHQLDAQAWASEQSLIASCAVVRNKRVRPTCIDSLPYRTEFTTDDIDGIVAVLEREVNNAPMIVVRVARADLEQEVISAVANLPCFPQSALWTAFDKLKGQGSEFDDVRTELIGMAFDYASAERGPSYEPYTLINYAMRMLDERIVTPAITTINQTQTDIANECGALCALLIEKNRKYGDSALNPVHIFSKDPAHVQLRQLIDHKLARIKRGDENIEDEDVTRDLIGYIVLYRIAIQRWKKGQTNANQVP